MGAADKAAGPGERRWSLRGCFPSRWGPVSPACAWASGLSWQFPGTSRKDKPDPGLAPLRPEGPRVARAGFWGGGLAWFPGLGGEGEEE